MALIRTTAALLFAGLSAACGKLPGAGKDKDKDEAKPTGIVREFAIDPVSFALTFNACSEDERNSDATDYSIKDVVLEQTACAYDAATRIQKRTEKRRDSTIEDAAGELKDYSYSETELDANGHILKVRGWKDATKAKVTVIGDVTYGAAGIATTARYEDVFETIRTVRTLTFDAAGLPVSTTTERFTGDKLEKTTVSNCASVFFDDRACEETEDGKVVEKHFLEGEEWVTQRTVKDKLVEVRRERPLPGVFGSNARSVSKTHSYSTGEVDYETVSTCAMAGTNVACEETRKNGAGAVLQTTKTVLQRAGTLRLKFGSTSRDLEIHSEIEGRSEARAKGEVITVTMTGAMDARGAVSAKSVTVKMAKQADAAAETFFVDDIPSWAGLPNTAFWATDVAAVDVTYKVVSAFDGKDRELSEKVTDFVGLAPDKVKPRVRFRTETVYR